MSVVPCFIEDRAEHARLIPIAAIITPATLSIFTAKVLPPPTVMSRVPNLHFRSLKFVDNLYSAYTYGQPEPHSGNRSFVQPLPCPTSPWYYGGPSHAVKAIANIVLASGSIVPIEPPHITNASWALQFSAPKLSCKKAEAHIVAQVQRNIIKFYKDERYYQRYGYLAWARSAKSEDIGPFQQTSNGTNAGLSFSPGRHLDHNLFIGLFPKLFTFGLSFSDIYEEDVGENIYQCGFYNATYRISFDYSGTSQSVHIDDTHVAEVNQQIKVLQSVWGPNVECISPQPSNSLYSSCGLCNWDEFPFREFSYQAVVDAFVQNVKGQIFSDLTRGSTGPAKIRTTADTAITDTVLTKASDMVFLENPEPDAPGFSDSMSWEWAQRKGSLVQKLQGLITHPQEARSLPLAGMLHQVFDNYIVSLMSSPELRPNSSSSTAPPPVRVTSHKYRNVYAYSRWKLWVPYGIAILLTLVAVCIGMSAIVVSGASYSENFSTVFRAAKGAQTSLTEFSDQDLDWKDPLPDRIGKASIFLRPATRAEHASASYELVQPIESAK